MMVDEQFPLQRKILKGQVYARSEETRLYKQQCAFYTFYLIFVVLNMERAVKTGYKVKQC